METAQTQKPITDLSPHVVHLAREIDRLSPGTYEITINKPEFKKQEWPYEIIRKEKISSGNLSSTYLSE